MLTLPIKKKWFDMILSGEKKEEYRKIKPYYTTRFANAIFLGGASNDIISGKSVWCPNETEITVMFRNGYSKTSPSFVAKCRLSIGTGKEEWGAEKGKEYFVLKIIKIVKENNNVHDEQ